MFTGLVEAKGTVLRRAAHGKDVRLVIQGGLDLAKSPLELGESIAVDGVCLTVAAIPAPDTFEADASAETIDKTTLGGLAAGARVNLERAVPLGGRMGGHIVSGHVDAVGRIAEKAPLGLAVKVTFEAPAELMRFIAPKGSICISGVSLTVNNVGAPSPRHFDVVLIPHTRDKTSLDALPTGAPVNLEVDLLARYVARLLETGRMPEASTETSDKAWIDRLTRAGYM